MIPLSLGKSGWQPATDARRRDTAACLVVVRKLKFEYDPLGDLYRLGEAMFGGGSYGSEMAERLIAICDNLCPQAVSAIHLFGCTASSEARRRSHVEHALDLALETHPAGRCRDPNQP
jgi:hypothetical protein